MNNAKPLDLAAIRARADAATEGPWAWAPPSADNYPVGDQSLLAPPKADGDPVEVLSGWGWDASGTTCEPFDREFIAHARTDIPALLDAIAARDATLAEVAAALDTTERDEPSEFADHGDGLDDGVVINSQKIARILAQSPADSLAKVRADAWDEGHAYWQTVPWVDDAPDPRPGNPYSEVSE